MHRATHRITLALGLTASTLILAPPSSGGDLDQVEKDSWSNKADFITTAQVNDADATSRDNTYASIAATIEEAREIPSVADARNTAALIEIKRLRDELKTTQSKVQDLENRTAASAFTPPASLNLAKDEQVDPVNHAYPITVGKALRLAQVHFNSSSIELSPSAERLTREAAEWIKTLSTKKIIVAGFSDTIGPADVNMKISKMRATKVAALLESAGIDPSMIEIVGSGEKGLPQKTGDNVAEPMNRCVGIIAVPGESQS